VFVPILPFMIAGLVWATPGAATASRGALEISGTPYGARVIIEGARKQRTEWLKHNAIVLERIPTGRYVIKVSMDGYESRTYRGAVRDSQTSTLRVQLNKIQLYKVVPCKASRCLLVSAGNRSQVALTARALSIVTAEDLNDDGVPEALVHASRSAANDTFHIISLRHGAVINAELPATGTETPQVKTMNGDFLSGKFIKSGDALYAFDGRRLVRINVRFEVSPCKDDNYLKCLVVSGGRTRAKSTERREITSNSFLTIEYTADLNIDGQNEVIYYSSDGGRASPKGYYIAAVTNGWIRNIEIGHGHFVPWGDGTSAYVAGPEPKLDNDTVVIGEHRYRWLGYNLCDEDVGTYTQSSLIYERKSGTVCGCVPGHVCAPPASED
jgi:hypothetical protein